MSLPDLSPNGGCYGQQSLFEFSHGRRHLPENYSSKPPCSVKYAVLEWSLSAPQGRRLCSRKLRDAKAFKLAKLQTLKAMP